MEHKRATRCKIANRMTGKVDYCFTSAAHLDSQQVLTSLQGLFYTSFANKCPMCETTTNGDELSRNGGFCVPCSFVNYDEAVAIGMAPAKYQADLWLSYAVTYCK